MAKKSSRSSTFGDFGSDVMDTARDRPIVTAAVTAAAVGAGVFLWSRRNQISNQISQLSDQISEWTENFRAGEDAGGLIETDEAEGSPATTASPTRRTGTSRGMSETGGGNSTLGAQTGGGGTTGSVSGRGRARSTTPEATR